MQQVTRKVRKTAKKAFTLVEILIVVVILGILAAIVVPQFTDAANEARGGNVATQESTMETQLELFAARNNGNYPDLVTDGWGDQDTAGTMIGDDYLKDIPVSPFASGTVAERSTIVAFGDADTTPADITTEAAAADPEDGAWIYNEENGLIRAARDGN